MNYFAHGFRFVDRPYLLAGTAVPDWLSVVNRRARARRRLAAPFVSHPESQVSEIAQGILQHHHDDRWFHQTPAFAELSLRFTLSIRERLPQDDSFRPSFLGHILVELLLDAALIETDPQRAEQYYAAIGQLDPVSVTATVNRMTTQSADSLATLIRRFSTDQFLFDYLEDEKLLWRLNHVMRRVRLAALPESLVELFPAARAQVRSRRLDLIAGESSSGAAR